MPKNKEGFEVLTSFARGNFIKYSPYWAVVFGFAMLFIGFRLWGSLLNVPTGISELSEAYFRGIEYGIGLSFLGGLVGGFVLENLLSKFRCWQIMSEEVYTALSDFCKHIAYVFIALSVGYYIVANQSGFSIDPVGFLTILGIAVAIAVAYREVSKVRKS